MRNHRFSLFGHTLVTPEDFSHSLLPASSADLHKIEFVVKRQQQAPNQHQCVQIFPQENSSSNAKASLYLYRGENFLRIVYLGFATYDLFEDEIFCYPTDLTSTKRLHLNFLGPVMSLWLEHHDFLVLHASSILVDHKAVLFLADSQQGKSTIAVSMIKMGYPVLSDDLVPIKYNQIDDKFLAYPSYPVIKLWPDQFKRLFENENADDYLDKELRKCRMRVDELDSDLFCNRPYPISMIFHLSRREDLSALSIEPLSKIDAITKLIQYSFAAPIMIATGWQPDRLKEFSTLASYTPGRDLRYPTDVHNQDSLCEKIITNLAR